MWMDPHRTGSFLGQCAQYCETQHAKMLLRVSVDSPQAFAAWVRSQQQPAVQDQSDAFRRITSRNPGLDLRSRSCNKCLRLFRKPESSIVPLRAFMFHPLFVRITCGWRINDGMGTARRLIEPE
jgi:hypothetical protein